MKRMDETMRKKIFCVLVARGVAPEQAVLRAGWGQEERDLQAAVLLGDGKIRKEIARLSKELQAICSPAAAARAGLERLALEESVLLEGDEAAGGRVQDLLHISEIRYPKGGGVEIKLVDRIKALSLLAGLGQEAQDSGSSLLQALALSAQKLQTGDDPA